MERHGVDSLCLLLGNVNPYALFDSALVKEPADPAPALVASSCPR